MPGTGLIIAAHGSNAEPTVNAVIREMAALIAQCEQFDEVCCAFHQGKPGYADVVDSMRADKLIVVPLMTSQGHYADTVLPRALSRAERWSHIALRRTPAVGCHPRMPALLCARAAELLAQFALLSTETAVVVVGHGTPNHPQSRETTLHCVEELARANAAVAALPAFLDDEPSIEDVASTMSQRSAIIIPFLIGRGLHASIDIAKRFGMNVAENGEPPLAQEVSGRTVVLDLPIGGRPQIIDLVIDLASDASSDLERVQA